MFSYRNLAKSNKIPQFPLIPIIPVMFSNRNLEKPNKFQNSLYSHYYIEISKQEKTKTKENSTVPFIPIILGYLQLRRKQ